MLFLLNQHNARHHILDPETHFEDEAWRKEDIQIVLWICRTLASDLINAVISVDCTAYMAWTRLHDFFLDHQSSRAMYLGKAFRSTPRGDMSISAYCDKLKSLSDALADVNAPVDDRSLTLQMLAGLDKKFELHSRPSSRTSSHCRPSSRPAPNFSSPNSPSTSRPIRRVRRPLPFMAVPPPRRAVTTKPPTARRRNRPVAANSCRMAVSSRVAAAAATRSSRAAAKVAAADAKDVVVDAAEAAVTTAAAADSTNSRAGGGGQQPWLGYFAPMGAPFPQLNHRQPWVPPNAGSVLGPNPGNQARAYHVQYNGPPTGPYGAPPSWDHNAMIHAAPSYQPAHYQPAAFQPEWHMDSGASSHVTGNPVEFDPFGFSRILLPGAFFIDRVAPVIYTRSMAQLRPTTRPSPSHPAICGIVGSATPAN
ncbi:unnamed protein product [Alopecurus aequalis]